MKMPLTTQLSYETYAECMAGLGLLTAYELDQMIDQRAEQWAESGWLRHAESGTDDGFDQWEMNHCF